ncbi:MAG: hypothetical protein DMG79_10615 [Acidobacteria bacterium]|nr:MAG: hypothetical protein DMG79_10615 [Acidobacteriota bacterium]
MGKNGIPMPRSPRISVIQLRYSNMKGNLGTGRFTTRGICNSENVLPTLYSSWTHCIYLHANVDAPLYATDECLFQEVREPQSSRGAALHRLQLWPHHKMLRITAAMAAGLTEHVWTLEEIARLAN